ncbi:aminotransferase [Proteiniclasticum sp. BAD-10]|uniref:dUTP diphosphatase n=1 Tax=Proteiniclasticum sediminis TaxID=2804028 RepID=A0A941HRH5_9CLOT|nr:aminotransferase [Proteiniclasticum sediminis]MBR0576985.1 aminotransferase [Proteiniclasticum sediminis]
MKYEIIPIQLQEGGKIPVYANYNDAGADVFAAEDLVLRPMEKLVVPLNFSVALPDHLEMQVRPRSGLSLKTTLAIPNSPGTVDAGYRDPVGVIVENTYNIAQLPYALLYDEELRTKVQKEGKILKPDEAKAIFSTYSGSSLETPETLALFPFLVLDAQGNPWGTLYLEKGMKIAQVVFLEVVHAKFEVVPDVRAFGEDRGGGYGSTGLK